MSFFTNSIAVKSLYNCLTELGIHRNKDTENTGNKAAKYTGSYSIEMKAHSESCQNKNFQRNQWRY